MPEQRKKVLFVDDEAMLLELLQTLMGRLSKGQWDILTAANASEALALLQQHRVDLLVLDLHMPVVDGMQFLRLLQRKFPQVLKVVLTGDANDAARAACLGAGAELFLEKPRDDGAWPSIFATLNEVLKFQPEEGFRGVLRRVGLQDVLQMECLARNSIVLKVHAGGVSGNIFVKAGRIIHAEDGARKGEDAFNHLLKLQGGEFDLLPYHEPPEETIQGQWEFLLMEAARKRDEASEATPSSIQTDLADALASTPAPRAATAPPVVPVLEARPGPAEGQAETSAAAAPDATRPQVEELLICSLQGEVLHEWQSPDANGRIGFIEFLSRKSKMLGQGLPLGEFDRVELAEGATRVVAQIKGDRAIFVRTRLVPAGVAEDRAAA
jgi:CheY-like chemotaxis protein